MALKPIDICWIRTGLNSDKNCLLFNAHQPFSTMALKPINIYWIGTGSNSNKNCLLIAYFLSDPKTDFKLLVPSLSHLNFNHTPLIPPN